MWRLRPGLSRQLSDASMTPDAAYRWLMLAATPEADPFEVHAMASILALAADDLSAGTGLDRRAFDDLSVHLFPGAAPILGAMADRHVPDPDVEEQAVRDLLLMYAAGGCLDRHYAILIARRCRWPHHLWQDLGLASRAELSRLMRSHFPRLVERNAADMKWKKFLYRLVCGVASVCPAPTCSDCDDFPTCFGDEDGESRLARIRNGIARNSVAIAEERP